MPKITVVLPISRPNRIQATAEIIGSQVIPEGYEMDIVAVIDNTEVELSQVDDYLKKTKLFKRIFQFDRVAAGEFNSSERRDRICQVLQKAASMIRADSDFVFCLEDDTGVGETTVSDLLADYLNLTNEAHTKVGLVSGLEAGRWGYKMIGAWKVDRIDNPSTIETIPFSKKHILQEVDASGFYAFLTPAKLFKEHNFTWHDECFGPDVVYGLTLREKGYRNFVDWTILADHVGNGGRWRVDEECVVIRYRKDEAGIWRLESVV